MLITGATGTLGREVVRAAVAAGHSVVALSHNVTSPKFRHAGWVLGDLSTGEGLRAAIKDAQAVIHAASDRRRPEAVDVEGTRRLIDVARREGVGHFVQVSMAGIDEIPLRYYRAKRAAEQVVVGGGLPYSILRVTQFHHSVDRQFRDLAAIPLVMPLPKEFFVQSVDVREVAARLVRCLGERPRGRMADFGGPQVMPVADAASEWMRANGIAKPIVNVPVPGAIAAAFKAQRNTVPFGERGKISWLEWLKRDVSSPIEAMGCEHNQPADVRRVS